MANKAPDEIAAMVESARSFLKANSLRTMSASSDEVVRKQGEQQMAEFLNNFKGWSSQDLNNLQGALLKKFDEEMQNAPLRIDGKANPVRENLNKEMRNVFQNLFDIQVAVKKEEDAVIREAEVVDDAVARELEVERVAPKPVEPKKTFLQKIKEIVDNGVQAINAKTAEIRTNIDTRAKERKIEKEVKKSEQGGSFFERLAQKAKDKITELGEKAMERIMKLSPKKTGGDVEMKTFNVSEPQNVQHNQNLNAVAEKLQNPATSIESTLKDVLKMLDEAPTVPDDADINDVKAILAAKATLHDYPELQQQSEVNAEPLDPNSQAEAIVEQLQEEVHGVEQKFEAVVASMEILEEKVEVSAPVTREDVQNMEFNFDFDTSAFGPDTKDAKAVEVEARQGIKNLESAENKIESAYERDMDALEKALKELDSPASEKAADKVPDPGTPRSGNDSGPSTPRGGP